jgi:signal peptidase I
MRRFREKEKNNLSQTKGRATWRRLLWGRKPLWTAVRIILLATASLIVFKLVLYPVRITGKSMEPTCSDGQIGFIYSLAYVRQTPKRGDIIGFRLDNNDRQIIVKRIIGLPGESVGFHRGTVFINGREVAEPYLPDAGAWEWPDETLDSKSYFVIGDNRLLSQQYRIEEKNILGKLYSWHH